MSATREVSRNLPHRQAPCVSQAGRPLFNKVPFIKSLPMAKATSPREQKAPKPVPFISALAPATFNAQSSKVVCHKRHKQGKRTSRIREERRRKRSLLMPAHPATAPGKKEKGGGWVCQDSRFCCLVCSWFVPVVTITAA